MSHLKNNYIFGILESRSTIWHTFKQISSTFNFWPPYNPMGSFWSPVFQNAQWCQSGISLFACQDMSKSQKQQKYCNYTRLPSPKFILLFVNSTINKVTNFSWLEVLGGHSIDWLFTHISIRLERDWFNWLSIFAIKGCLRLASTNEFKHTIKAPFQIIFLSYFCNILPQHVFLKVHGL